MFANNISNIKLISSESFKFFIINGRIFNVSSHSNYYLFIFCSVSSDAIKNNRVLINNILIKRFS